MAAASGAGVDDEKQKQNRRWFDKSLKMLIEFELENEKVIFSEIEVLP